MFSVQYNGAGVVDGINKLLEGETAPVPPAIENQDFCDFLTWDCSQPNPIDPSISPRHDQQNHYFSDLPQLVKHCQQRGMMISVRKVEGLSPTVNFGDIVDYAPPNGAVSGTFHVLREAVEDEDRMFHHETDGITSRPTNVCVSPNLLAAINTGITDETSDIRRLVSWPISRVFVYVDVSDFSNMPAGQQALVINSIINIVNKESWEPNAPRNYEANMCIGDGYIFVFRDALDAVRFGGQFAMLVEVMGAKQSLPVEFHFRMGIHMGDVYCFWDTGRKGWNYIGDGINGGQRVLAAVGKESDDVIYVSDHVRRQIIHQNDSTTIYRTVLASMSSKGRKPDKHGRLWRVFEVTPRLFTTLKAEFQQ